MTPRLRAIVVLTIDCSVPEAEGGVCYCAVRTRPSHPPSTASAEGLDDHKVSIEPRGDTLPRVVRVHAAGGPEVLKIEEQPLPPPGQGGLRRARCDGNSSFRPPCLG
jgi:hypothetical protein